MSIYTDKQLELMRLWQRDELKRINILEGSVSSGKTWISLVLWAFWVKTMPNNVDSLYLMSAKTLTNLKRNCLIPLQGLVGENNFSFTLSSKEGSLFGRHILLEGANDAQAESKIRGLTLQGAYCDEATKLPEDFFAMLLSRLRKPNAILICTTNPDKPSHWLKTKYIDRDDLDLLDVHFHIDDNTTLTPEYVENIKKEYTGVFYDRFITGRWTLAEGLIYPMYKDAIADPPEEPPRENKKVFTEYALSVDYGTMNAFACILWEKHGDVWYATRNYYYSGRDTGKTLTDEEYLVEVEALVADIMEEREEYRDQSGIFQKMQVIIDPSAASFIALLRKHKKSWFTAIPAVNDVLEGIQCTATALKQGYIKISPRLKPWIMEAEGYVWDASTTEERPVKERDHDMDATRYLVMTKRVVQKQRRRAF